MDQDFPINNNKNISKRPKRPKNHKEYVEYEEELLGELRHFINENGRVPKIEDFRNNPKYHHFMEFYRVLDGWNNAIKKIGYTVNIRKTKYNRKELLSYLRNFMNKYERTPKQEDFKHSNGEHPSYSPYIQEFGNWNNALQEAGLSINYHTQLSDEDLLNFLLKFNFENGRSPTESDFYKSDEYPSFVTYINRFGSWTNALKMVDLDTDSLIEEGIIPINTDQKGRKAEITVMMHFFGNATDLSEENKNSPCDGICPNNLSFDVKSSSLERDYRFIFIFKNKQKDNIDIYYLLGFNEDYTSLLYAWRIPKELVKEKDRIYVYISENNSEFTIESMKSYDITEKLKAIVNGGNKLEYH